MVLPGGSVPTDTVITLTPTVLSTFVPTAAGIDALAEMTLDLGRTRAQEGVASKIFVSWNQVAGWLRALETLRRAA